MNIKTQEDWIVLARKTIPLLGDYVEEFKQIDRGKFEAELQDCLDKQDWQRLHQRFEDIWFALPDIPSIRHRPFFDLCDLCSEWEVWID